MVSVKRQVEVPYSCQAMYALVNDIGAYPEFVPYCGKSKIISQTDQLIVAELSLAGAGFEKCFTTANRLTPYSKIELSLVDGPFKSLTGFWHFVETRAGCRVELELQFEFASSVLNMMIGPLFTKAANQLVDSFSERALAIYGQSVHA